MKSRCLIGIFALTALGASTPAFSAEDEPGGDTPSFVVSSEFMDTLEQWSSPAATAESLALASRPELIEEYAALAEDHYGQPLADVFAEHLPQTWAEIAGAWGSGEDGEDGEAPAAADLLAYALAGGSGEFHSWQASMADQGADFRGFVAEAHPDVMTELATAGPSPADQGVGLRDFAEAKGTAGGLDALAFAPSTQQQLLNCYCFTAVSFEDQPGPGWLTQVNQSSSSAFASFQYSQQARGAARDLEFHRRSRHRATEELRDFFGNTSIMRVNLTCLRMPVLVGSNPRACAAADTCTAKLYARVGYASRVAENHSAHGIFAKQAKALAADFARLSSQASVSSLGLQRFASGVAVAGSSSSDWNDLRNLAAQFYPASMPLSSVLSVITGGAGGHSRTMTAGWDSFNQPITLQPGQTYTFRLETSSRSYGRGFGDASESRHQLDSAYYLMAMTRRGSCAPGGYGLDDRAFWNYAGAPDAPYDLVMLRNLVRASANSVGSGVSNVSAAPGQYP